MASDYATTTRQWNGLPLMRFRLVADDERFGLREGDILLCEEMNWAWADEKVAVVRRESDAYVPMCSQYRHSVEFIEYAHDLNRPIERTVR